MATVINNPRPMVDRSEVVETRSGAGFVLGVIAAIILGILLLAYAVPALRSANRSTLNVPDRINVDVNGSGSTGTQAQ
jgi:hypothetical protein